MDRISNIFYRQLTGQPVAREEEDELRQWIEQDIHTMEVGSELTDFATMESEYRCFRMVDRQKALADMNRRIASLPSNRRRRILHRSLTVAAVFMLIFATGNYFMRDIRISNINDTSMAVMTGNNQPHNSRTIIRYYRSAATPLAASKSGGNIASDNPDDPSEDGFQKLSVAQQIHNLSLEVPRGGEFKVTLEDSTEVWLNSESTLRYPEVFGTDERRVEVSGEAYFKVKKDTSRPFYVISAGQKIRVYGTTFNVRAYTDEQSVLTTLESGSISMTRIDGAGGELKLSPGHQTVFDKSEEKVTVRTVNPEVVTAWRYGKFIFDEQPLSVIMRDLARWYNFKYEFADQSAASIVFKGKMSRHDKLEDVLEILAYGGNVNFLVKNGTVYIERRHQ